jgi:hypothetical protein
MKHRRTNVCFDGANPAMTIVRSRYWSPHMVYVVRGDKGHKYKTGRSRIVYIGQTRRGTKRPAHSAAKIAINAFVKMHGVKRIDVYPMTCSGRSGLRMWEILERDLIITFKHKHGEVPHFNVVGKGRGFNLDKISCFRKRRLLNIIERLGA